MRAWDAERIARASGARVRAPAATGADPGPSRATIDSRAAGPGELFVGLPGERRDGGEFATEALARGAWGVMVREQHALRVPLANGTGAVLVHADPLAGLQALARAWRRERAAAGLRVVAITGSTGKTSTKDILTALIAPHARVAASPENLNTEIGMPLAMLAADEDTDVMVLEMAMRGAGQIAELAAIAQPNVGVIVNVGPVHLELLGSLEAIAAAKAELIEGLRPGASVVLPATEPLLARHLRADLRTLTFGAGGDVYLEREGPEEVAIRIPAAAEGARAPAAGQGQLITLRPSFSQAHNLRNLLAATAAALALGITPAGAVEVSFSALRGERRALPGGVVLIDDCYNANPMSMCAAIDELARSARGRRVAVLGDMLELGADAPRFHREVGAHAARRGVELLVTVGPLAAEMGAGFAGTAHSVPDARTAAELLPALLHEGDTVLVKASRGVGLELVGQTLGASQGTAVAAAEPCLSSPGGGSRRR